MYKVTGQFFPNRQGDRNRGLSEGMLPMVFVNKTFESREEAEVFCSETFPQNEKMREYHTIEEII